MAQGGQLLCAGKIALKMLKQLYRHHRIASPEMENIEADMNVIFVLMDDLIKKFVGPRCYKHREHVLGPASKIFSAELYNLIISEICMFQTTDAYNKVNILDILMYIGSLPMNESGIIPVPVWFKQVDYSLVFPAHTERIEILSKIEYDFGITITDEPNSR
jgi:hypothetical protein